MSDLELNCLRMLRIFGPCSNAEVARRLGECVGRTYRAIGRLEQSGLVCHPKLQVWALTPRGRKYFQSTAAKPLQLFQGGE